MTRLHKTIAIVLTLCLSPWLAAAENKATSGTGGIIEAIKEFQQQYLTLNTEALQDNLTNDKLTPPTRNTTSQASWQNYLSATTPPSDMQNIYATYQTLMSMNVDANMSLENISNAFSSPENMTVNNVSVPASVLQLSSDAKRIRFIQESLKRCIKVYSQNTQSSSTTSQTSSDPLLTWAPICTKATARNHIDKGNLYLQNYADYGFVTSVSSGETNSSSTFVFDQAKTAQSALESLQKVLEKAVFIGLYDTSFQPNQNAHVDPTHDQVIQASTIVAGSNVQSGENALNTENTNTNTANTCRPQNVISSAKAKELLQSIDHAYPLNLTLPTTLIPPSQPTLALIPNSGDTVTRLLTPSSKGISGKTLGSLATTIAQRRQGYQSDIQDGEEKFVSIMERLHQVKQSVINDTKFLLQERTPVQSGQSCTAPLHVAGHNALWRDRDATWKTSVKDFTTTQALQELVRMRATELANQHKMYLMQERILMALTDLRLMQLNEQRSLAQSARDSLQALTEASDQGASSSSTISTSSIISSLTSSNG